VEVAQGQVPEHEHARARVRGLDGRTERGRERGQRAERQPDVELVRDADRGDRFGDALAERPKASAPRTVVGGHGIPQPGHRRDCRGQVVEHRTVSGRLDEQRWPRPGEWNGLTCTRRGELD
jgi:hypothetical protein